MSEPSLERVPPVWPLSRDLLQQIIDDRISDCFVAELIWERLGYQPSGEQGAAWLAGPTTPQAWKQVFPKAPPVIIATLPSKRPITPLVRNLLWQH